MNCSKIDPEVVKQKIAEGVVHLEFVAKLYRKQYNRGKHFVHDIRLARSQGIIRQFFNSKGCQTSTL